MPPVQNKIGRAAPILNHIFDTFFKYRALKSFNGKSNAVIEAIINLLENLNIVIYGLSPSQPYSTHGDRVPSSSISSPDPSGFQIAARGPCTWKSGSVVVHTLRGHESSTDTATRRRDCSRPCWEVTTSSCGGATCSWRYCCDRTY